MPDDHRGPHPQDERDLGAAALPALREATSDLSWLLGRGYTDVAGLKVVGDRWGLTRRQRLAVMRCACTDAALASRKAREVAPAGPVDVDAFNTLITLERALSGGPVLVGRDGACRDLAGVHGTWRAVLETPAAIVACGEVLADAGAGPVRWLVDQPVSNSGRLAQLIRDVAEERGWPWQAEVIARVDPALAESAATVVTSDAWILDRAGRWANLVRRVIDRFAPSAWRVDLGSAAAA